MKELSLLQKFMAVTLTTGFIAHDYYYINKYVIISLVTAFFLTAILWFHTLVFLHMAGYTEIISEAEAKNINRLRAVVAVITILLTFSDTVNQVVINKLPLLTYKNITEAVFSLLLVIFPEMVFKMIFKYRRKEGQPS
jgi:hypothetical protein